MSSIVLSDAMNSALKQVSTLLRDFKGKWLVGGSCGLILQHIALAAQPRDLDIYADNTDIECIATALADYAIDEPHYSETPIYRSNLSRYLIAGVPIELVGGFRVNCGESNYRVEVNDVMSRYSSDYTDTGLCLKLMPLAHEMVFNLLRNRADRYDIIAKEMKASLNHSIPALQEIISRNRFSAYHLKQLSQLLGLQLHSKSTTD